MKKHAVNPTHRLKDFFPISQQSRLNAWKGPSKKRTNLRGADDAETLER